MFNKLKNLMPSRELELLTPLEVKSLLKCSLPYVYKLAERNKLPCLRLPCLGEKQRKTLLRFKKRDVFDFIEANYRTNN